jgi:hypothetical protein
MSLASRSSVLRPPCHAVICACAALAACTGRDAATDLDGLAATYVETALRFDRHDPDYVDAYFGPPAWQSNAESDLETLAELRARADSALAAVTALEPSRMLALDRQRGAMLAKRFGSLLLRMDMVDPARERSLPLFDEESRILFDAVAPDNDAEHFRRILDQIAALIPGEAPLPERVEAFRRQFEIPKDRLAVVFEAAIAECRRRTLLHLPLPDTESFVIEYVTDQPWSGYNWYKGDYFSLIQINTDLPTFIDRAVDLGCHEGYPGHHVNNVLLERDLVEGKGWIEFAVNALYGPQSLISEGSANYGIELAFPGDERIAFERDVLFPLAGLDAALAERYYALGELLEQLSFAGNEAARDYLNGAITAEQAVDWLVRYTLTSPERAAQRVRFFDTYRSYVINYNLGQDLVRDYVEARAGGDPQRRWMEFERLLATPITPSDLVSATQ